jgi:hypothetical protein
MRPQLAFAQQPISASVCDIVRQPANSRLGFDTWVLASSEAQSFAATSLLTVTRINAEP